MNVCLIPTVVVLWNTVGITVSPWKPKPRSNGIPTVSPESQELRQRPTTRNCWRRRNPQVTQEVCCRQRPRQSEKWLLPTPLESSCWLRPGCHPVADDTMTILTEAGKLKTQLSKPLCPPLKGVKGSKLKGILPLWQLLYRPSERLLKSRCQARRRWVLLFYLCVLFCLYPLFLLWQKEAEKKQVMVGFVVVVLVFSFVNFVCIYRATSWNVLTGPQSHQWVAVAPMSSKRNSNVLTLKPTSGCGGFHVIQIGSVCMALRCGRVGRSCFFGMFWPSNDNERDHHIRWHRWDDMAATTNHWLRYTGTCTCTLHVSLIKYIVLIHAKAFDNYPRATQIIRHLN